MELVSPLRVVDAVLVGEADEEVEAGAGGEMCVVNSGLRHLVQTFVEGRIFKFLLHFVVVAQN